jgi:flagellar assembly factor FliW
LAFHWLQSIDRPDIGFLVSDPNLFSENYSLVIDYDMKEQLRFEKNDEMVVMIIVTVKDRGKTITGNLLGPIVVNATKRLGCQATSGTSECDTAAPLRSNERVGTESDNKKAGVTV